MRFEVRVDGIDALRHKIQMMQNQIPDILEKSVYEGATIVAREAQANSERGGQFPNRITGNLFRSLVDGSPAIVSKSNTRVVAAVGSSMDYARRLELGFMGTDSRGRRYHQPAKPYLRPALDNNQDRVQEEIRRWFLRMMGGGGVGP